MNLSKKIISIISEVTGIPPDEIAPDQNLSKDLGISDSEITDIANELSLQLNLPPDTSFSEAKTIQDLIMAVENSALLA